MQYPVGKKITFYKELNREAEEKLAKEKNASSAVLISQITEDVFLP